MEYTTANSEMEMAEYKMVEHNKLQRLKETLEEYKREEGEDKHNETDYSL